jgi:hypothetical protein
MGTSFPLALSIALSLGVAACSSGAAMEPADAKTDAPVVDSAVSDAAIDAGPVDESQIDAGTVDASLSLADLCDTEPVTPGDWERCYHKRWCQWRVGCSPENSYRNLQECIAESDEIEGGIFTAESRANERAVNQKKASINIPAFTQCLLDTSSAFCDTARSSVACATRYTGIVEDGGACYTDIECASPGATCESKSDCTAACCLGTCQPGLKEGESCIGGRACEPGLVCHGTCLSGDIGTSCQSFRDCDENAWCNDGICTADFEPGAACTNLSQCSGETRCLGLSIVDSSLGMCLRTSQAGDPCDLICYGNLYCDGSGTCRDLPKLGQSCSFEPCSGYDTFCSNGKCVQRGDVGATCGSSQSCLPGLFCTSELNDPNPKCAARRGEGEPCADPSHCESFLCSGNTAKPGVCLPWSNTCPPGVDMMNSAFQ